MAGRIAGITIEIGGNTTKLQSALKGVNGSIRGLKSSLRDVDRLLKFKPTSTELLKQKQQMLRTAIDQTKSKLDTLNQAMDQMKAEGVDETSEEYQRLQREIIATEQELKNLENEYNQVASVAGVQMEAVGDKMQEVGQKISEVGDAITQKVTVPLVALGGAAVAAFISVDKGMDTIVAKTGASGEALESMKNIAKDLASEIPTDFETAGAAVGEVNTRFKLTGKELEDLSGQFIKFAKLNNTDVSTSIDAVQAAMAAFGLSSDQAGAYLDTLNAVGQQTGADVNRLAQDMVTNAASFKALGFSASDAAHFLGELSVNGVDSSQVMVGLKKAFVQATKDGVSMKDKLAELQNTMKNADSDTEAYAAAMELFGNRAGPALASAIREGRLSLDELGTSLEDNLGNIDQTFANTLDPVDEFKMALNNLKIVGADFGKSLLSVVSPAIKKLTSIIQTLQKKWQSLTPAQQQSIVKMGLMAAAVGPVVKVFGKLTSGLGSFVKIAGKAVNAVASIIAGTAGIGTVLGFAGAVAGVGAALYIMHQRSQEAIKAQHGLTEEQKEVINSLDEATQAYKEVDEARREATESIVADAQYSQQLVDEYNSLIDSNGKVKKGYEDRANFIKSQLAEALGVEKSKIDDLIGANGKLDSSVKQLIETKKAEAILDANKDAYTEAIKQRQSAVENLGPALQTLAEKEQAVKDAQAQVAEAQRKYDQDLQDGGRTHATYKNQLENAKSALEGASEAYDKAKSSVDEYSQTLEDANNEIANYEGLAAALASKDEEAMSQYASALTEGIKTRANATQAELQEQAQIITDQYELIKAAYESGQAGVTQEMVDAAKARMDAANTEAGSVSKSAKAEKDAIVSNTDQAQRDATQSFKKISSSAGTYMSEAGSEVTKGAKTIKSNFPIDLGKLFTGTLTTIAAKIKDAAGEKSVSYSTGVQRFAKAYTNPYIFTTPALLNGGRLVGDRGSQAGGELVYGRDNLLNDIREAANPITAEQLYNIVLAALDHADMRVNISGREFARIVREV